MISFFKQLEQETVAEREALTQIPLLVDALQGAISKATYLAFLEQAYHHVKHTVPLLMACGSRLPFHKEWLREAIAEYIEEETGHQEWILNDLTHAGGEAATVRHGAPNFATEMMVAYAYDTVMRGNPVAFFGMVYVLEGTSIAMATQCAEAISHALGLPRTCFSYLTSHGSLDIKHMQFFESLMNHVDDPADQAAILHAAKRFFVLYANIFRSIPHTHEVRHVA